MTPLNTTLISPAHDHWLSQAAALPLGFAQVREDSNIDLKMVGHLRRNADICLVASGGCTAACLAAGTDVRSITLVDSNQAQLALSRVKLHLLEKEGIEERLAILGHQPMDLNRRRDVVEMICKTVAISANTFGPPKLVATQGLDYSGRYEMLFARLQASLADCAQDDLEFFLSLSKPNDQVRFAKQSGLTKVFDTTFDETFVLRDLVALFGETATQNAFQPFAAHFRQRLAYAMETLPNSDNPYLHQLLAGRYASEPAPWLKYNSTKIGARIEFVHSQMDKFLRNKKVAFDFIGLSNILDWLSLHDAKLLLQASFESLRPGGMVLIRQLNSTLDIPAIAPDFVWQDTKKLEKNDRSFFYRRLHLGGK